ncbi:hypothetical protein D2V17_11975 [Aurantiacibacter xanthus]|uniref:Glycoside hydrolase n=1 Tax=Aurantiacibacter xanthus TaxID=1784712 RepID=A0A3A1P6S8_9SPHN|nr:glycosyl hydrolase [Aurantiacibacter xanthus]RIV84131.1 hypothetical protein D2V17_11975 [Aurantiacibacter xanthus]
MKLIGLLACASVLALFPSPAFAEESAPELQEGFQEPPQEARPHLWWHWMDGNVTVEGALADLEWMHRMGIGGVHAFSGSLGVPVVVDEPAPFMSERWAQAFEVAIERAHEYGMEVVIAGSPGWSQTGGPWVAPQDGMKKYVWSEVTLEGGQSAGRLPQPPVTTGDFAALTVPSGWGEAPTVTPEAYGDAAVFAFPMPGDRLPLAHYVSADQGEEFASLTPELSHSVTLPFTEGEDLRSVDIVYDEPVEVHALTMAMEKWPAFEIWAGASPDSLRPLASFAAAAAEHPSPQQTFALPATTAQHYRIAFQRPPGPPPRPGLPPQFSRGGAPDSLKIYRLELLGEARVNQFEAKAGFSSIANFDDQSLQQASSTSAIAPAAVVDLTSRLQADGTLDWTAPDNGRWTVVRLGWSLTGQTNGPAEPEATGLEVDKLDASAVHEYITTLLALYRDNANVALGEGGINALLTDSWEAGVQNWTPRILSDFERLRGYDPQPWLPVLVGRVVVDPASSEAFLFDFRQTLEDLLIENHYGTLARVAGEQGMTYYTEAQGDTPRAIVDGLAAKARADIPTAEFWYRPFATDPGQPSLIADVREAASAAHIYGKPFVAVEALTVAAGTDPWSFSPAMLQPVADRIFAYGANRLLLHESTSQPFLDRAPGLSLGFFGQFLNRNETWADEARPFFDYLARTSFMLQQGQYQADIAYFYGDEQSLSQLFHHDFNTNVPKGYGYDYLDARSLAHEVHVADGQLVTSGGMAYRILYMPSHVRHLTIATLERLQSLVEQGATLVADKPVGRFGMAGTEAQAAEIIDHLWGVGTGQSRDVGLGRVYPTSDLALALKAEGITPDVAFAGTSELLSLHRRSGETDIYYLSNQGDEPLSLPITFRATGTPQLWSADRGETRALSFARQGQNTEVSVPLDAGQSGFVVFQPSAATELTLSEPRTLRETLLDNEWEVDFQAQRGGPEETVTFEILTDWSENADPRIRYFSGAATYRADIDIDADMLESGTRLYLDLGEVNELATVFIDGREVGTAWKSPYRIDLTGQVTAGQHHLELKVTNLWVNRLIGDKQEGASPLAFAPQSPYTAESPLRSSGLLGPVRLVQTSELTPG